MNSYFFSEYSVLLSCNPLIILVLSVVGRDDGQWGLCSPGQAAHTQWGPQEKQQRQTVSFILRFLSFLLFIVKAIV